jgi:hypothetical protein
MSRIARLDRKLSQALFSKEGFTFFIAGRVLSPMGSDTRLLRRLDVCVRHQKCADATFVQYCSQLADMFRYFCFGASANAVVARRWR